MGNEVESGDQVTATPLTDTGDAAQASGRYERSIDVESESTHARVVRLVGSDQRVLELGPATGNMTRVLRDHGCTVVGIEIDPEMADTAGRYAERLIVGDLDELDLDAELGSDRFDVIVAADVLEHLRDPLSALRRLRSFLNTNGHFVISIPNVAHGSVRLALLQGHFDYQEVGLLDTTHLRFFTRESIGRLLDEAELAVAEIYHQPLDLDASEVPFDAATVPQDVLQKLSDDPAARIYQFVVKAVALDPPGLRELQRRLRELADENARIRDENARMRENEQRQLATFGGRERQLRSALIEAHDQALHRDEDINRLQEELKDLHVALKDAHVALKDAHVALEDAHAESQRLRVRLERITTSPPIRAYQALSTLPGLKGLRAARTAAYHRAVRSAGHSDGSSS